MIKQYVNDKSAGMTYAQLSSSDFGVLSPLLAGRSEHFDLGASGGTTFNAQKLNFKRISLGRKLTPRGSISKSVTFPHIKINKTRDDIIPLVVGNWDVDFDLSQKAEYCSLIGDSKKV